MPGVRSCATVWLAAAIVGAPGAAAAGDWSYADPDPDVRATQTWHYSARTGVWIGTYDRPQRACASVLRPGQFSSVDDIFSCPHRESDEVGLSAGVDVSYHAAGPLHFTMGIDLVYSDPEVVTLSNQVVLSVPFGALLTWYGWFLRPILHLTVSPTVFITDLDRDFTMGFDAGLAYRVPGLFDVSLTAGRAWSSHVDRWSVLLAFHPL